MNRQLYLPLFSSAEDAPIPAADLAGLMPGVKADMRRAAGATEGEGRKALPDSINKIVAHNEIRLTTGNAKCVTKDSIDKWLSPSDTGHPPSLLAVVVFCIATHDHRPLLRVVLALGRELAVKLVSDAARTLGLSIMDDQDKRDVAYGRACRMEREAKRAKKRLEENM